MSLKSGRAILVAAKRGRGAWAFEPSTGMARRGCWGPSFHRLHRCESIHNKSTPNTSEAKADPESLSEAKKQVEHRAKEKLSILAAEKVAHGVLERGVERGTDRAAEHAMERGAEQVSKIATERAFERSVERAVERSVETGAERASERGASSLLARIWPARFSKRAAEQGMEKGAEQLSKIGTERAFRRGAEHAVERSVKSGVTRAGERGMERGAERAAESAIERSAERASKVATKRAVEQGVERAAELSIEKSAEQVTERSASKLLAQTLPTRFSKSPVAKKLGGKIMARLGRGVVIGLPVLGGIFALHLAKHDFLRAKEEELSSPGKIPKAFYVAAVSDGADGVAHFVLALGIAQGWPHDSLYLLEYTSLGFAGISTIAVVAAEIMVARKQR
jgi:hypothetical protein